MSVADLPKSYAQTFGAYTRKDHSARLSLGGVFEPLGIDMVADGESPRVEIVKGDQTKKVGFD